jgi:hypothetical protein
MADYWMLLAEGHMSRGLFGSMLRMIAARRGRSGSEGQRVFRRRVMVILRKTAEGVYYTGILPVGTDPISEARKTYGAKEKGRDCEIN